MTTENGKCPKCGTDVWQDEGHHLVYRCRTIYFGPLHGVEPRLKESEDCLRRQLESASARLAAAESSCPCLHTTPCSSNCSCANPVQSGGCNRCCKHGSAKQKQAHAEMIAAQEQRLAAAEAVAVTALARRDARTEWFRAVSQAAAAHELQREGFKAYADECATIAMDTEAAFDSALGAFDALKETPK